MAQISVSNTSRILNGKQAGSSRAELGEHCVLLACYMNKGIMVRAGTRIFLIMNTRVQKAQARVVWPSNVMGFYDKGSKMVAKQLWIKKLYKIKI